MEKTKHLVLVAGEASGDMHAAHLVGALKKIDPALTFSGLGGEAMRQSGVKLYEDLTQYAVVGFWEVLKHYGAIKKAFDLILEKIAEVKPAAVILVDYPGFNLRLAKVLKKRNVKVIYYISPQVWAWKEKRVHDIQKNVDRMLVLFPFEKDFYARFGVDVDWVGHPLVDAVQVTRPREAMRQACGLKAEKLTIGILPGSRKKEVETLLPAMLEAARLLEVEFPHLQFLLIQAPTIERQELERHLPTASGHIRVVEGKTYDAINACDLCMVASGTATLETALLMKPMVVIYKTSLLTWVLAKLFVKIPYIGLVNVVAGKKIVPECIQFQATGTRIAATLKDIFTDELKIAEIKVALEKVRQALGEGGSSQRAAQKIIATIQP